MKKVVLLSQQGSGTNLLRSFINSHPDIFIDHEWFVHRNDKTGDFQRSKTSVTKFLEYRFHTEYRNDDTILDIGDNPGFLDVFGFDLKYNQVTSEILDFIIKNKISVIHLIRDPARTCIKNCRHGIHLARSHLITYCRETRENFAYYRGMFERGDYYEITFEDMTRGKEIRELPEDFEKALLNWLGVSYWKLRMSIKTKYNGEDIKISY